MTFPGNEVVAQCKVCHARFLAKSLAKVYCSPKCRQKDYRDRKRKEGIDKVLNKFLKELKTVIGTK